MAESQVTQQETPAQEPSQSQQEPPRQVGQPERKPREDNDQQAQRAAQVRKREQIERKNPFSRDNKSARMESVMASLRQQRGVPEPRAVGSSDDQGGKDAGDSDVRGGSAQPDRQPSDSTPHTRQDVKTDEKRQESTNNDPPEWYKQQQQLQAAERRASEASADADRKRAELEKVKADADAAVARMAAAKDDPVEFLAQQGMTQEEWSQFLANGGKLSPEQRKLKEMSDVIAKMQQRVDASEKREKEQAAQVRFAQEESQFAEQLSKYTFIPEMGGIRAVRERQRLLSQGTGQPVSLKDAAEHLEGDIGGGLKRILQNTKIRSSLGLDVNTSHAGQAAEPPRTLSNRVSSETTQSESAPHPLDWAAKRKLYQQRVERDRQAQLGR